MLNQKIANIFLIITNIMGHEHFNRQLIKSKQFMAHNNHYCQMKQSKSKDKSYQYTPTVEIKESDFENYLRQYNDESIEEQNLEEVQESGCLGEYNYYANQSQENQQKDEPDAENSEKDKIDIQSNEVKYQVPDEQNYIQEEEQKVMEDDRKQQLSAPIQKNKQDEPRRHNLNQEDDNYDKIVEDNLYENEEIFDKNGLNLDDNSKIMQLDGRFPNLITEEEKQNIVNELTYNCRQCVYIIEQQGQFLEQDDYYDLEYQSVVYFKLYNLYPPYVLSYQNQKTAVVFNRSVRLKGQMSSVIKCSRSNYHLLSRATGKLIPMLNKTYQILTQLHSFKHEPLIEVKRKARSLLKYDNKTLDKFAYGFISNCQLCKDAFDEKLPGHRSYQDNILDMMKEAKDNKIDLSKPPERVVMEIKNFMFDMKHCQFDCQKDTYEGPVKEMLDFCLYRLIPERLNNSTHHEKSMETKNMTDRMRYCRIVSCDKGTKHVWRVRMKYKNQTVTPQNFINMYRRIPMKGQLNYIMNKLHGANHLQLSTMIEILRNSPYAYRQIKAYLETNSNFCQQCCSKKANTIRKQQQRQAKNNMIMNNSMSVTSSQQLNQKNMAKLQNNLQIQQATNKIDNRMNPNNTIKKNSMKKINVLNNQSNMPLSNNQLKIRQMQRFEQVGQVFKLFGNIENTQIHGYPSPHDCKVLLIINKKMYENYVNFGDCLHFEHFSDLLEAGQQWQTFFFTGVDSYGRNRIFGACLLAQLTFQSYCYAFSGFFSVMGNKLFPLSIVTSYDKHIKQSLESIIYHTQSIYLRNTKHFFLWNSIITKFTQNLPEITRQAAAKSILEAMKAATANVYIMKINSVKKMLPPQLYRQFISNNNKCCLAQMQTAYIGKALDGKRSSSLSNNLREHMQTQVLLTQYVAKVLTLDKAIVLKQNIKHSATKPNQAQFAQLKSYLSPFLYEDVVRNVIRAINRVNVNVTKQISFKIAMYDQWGDHTIKFQPISNCWGCSCRKLQRNGIPCYHLLMAVLKNGGNLLFYINSRWFITNPFAIIRNKNMMRLPDSQKNNRSKPKEFINEQKPKPKPQITQDKGQKTDKQTDKGNNNVITYTDNNEEKKSIDKQQQPEQRKNDQKKDSQPNSTNQ